MNEWEVEMLGGERGGLTRYVHSTGSDDPVWLALDDGIEQDGDFAQVLLERLDLSLDDILCSRCTQGFRKVNRRRGEDGRVFIPTFIRPEVDDFVLCVG